MGSSTTEIVVNMAKIKCSKCLNAIRYLQIESEMMMYSGKGGMYEYAGRIFDGQGNSYAYEQDCVPITNIPSFGYCTSEKYASVLATLISTEKQWRLKFLYQSAYDEYISMAGRPEIKPPCLLQTIQKAMSLMSESEKKDVTTGVLLDRWFNVEDKDAVNSYMEFVQNIDIKLSQIQKETNILIGDISLKLTLYFNDLKIKQAKMSLARKKSFYYFLNEGLKYKGEKINPVYSESNYIMCLESEQYNINSLHKDIKTILDSLSGYRNKLLTDSDFKEVLLNFNSLLADLSKKVELYKNYGLSDDKIKESINNEIANVQELINIVEKISQDKKYRLLTTDSFLVCRFGGIITFVDSGHKRMMAMSKVFSNLCDCLEKSRDSIDNFIEIYSWENSQYQEEISKNKIPNNNDSPYDRLGKSVGNAVMKKIEIDNNISIESLRRFKYAEACMLNKLLNPYSDIKMPSDVTIYVDFIPHSTVAELNALEDAALLLAIILTADSPIGLLLIFFAIGKDLISITEKTAELIELQESGAELTEEQKNEINQGCEEILSTIGPDGITVADLYMVTKGKSGAIAGLVGQTSSVITRIQFINTLLYYSDAEWIEKIRITYTNGIEVMRKVYVYDKNENFLHENTDESMLYNKLAIGQRSPRRNAGAQEKINDELAMIVSYRKTNLTAKNNPKDSETLHIEKH